VPHSCVRPLLFGVPRVRCVSLGGWPVSVVCGSLRGLGSVCRPWVCRSRCTVSSWQVRVDEFELDVCVAEGESVGGFFFDESALLRSGPYACV